MSVKSVRESKRPIISVGVGAALRAPFRVIWRAGKRFGTERCAQTAAALSFATLLALVPMIAVSFALIQQFPAALGLAEALERFFLANLLPDKSGTVIVKYIGQFANRVDRVTYIGFLALMVTALMQMFTIEHAFDAIWGVKIRRSLWRRTVFHLVALVVGPLLFGGSLALMTYLVSVSLGLVNEPQWITALAGSGLSFITTTAVFALMYWGLPNKIVVPAHAVLGGLLAAGAFAGLKKLFVLYVAKMTTYTALYGAFSAIPVFLVWVYASWGVILIGALVVAELPRAMTK
jgi:membrane protein